MNRHKIAIIQTHPIQHFCPQFAKYAKLNSVDLTVIFETDKGYKPYFDTQFKKEIKWEGIDLQNFDHIFLNNKNITEILDKNPPDIIIIYGYHKDVQKKAFKWGTKNKKKIFYISDSEEHQKRNIFKRELKKIILKRFFNKIDIFLSVGDANEDYYKSNKIKKDRIVRMFFPIDTEKTTKILEKKKHYIKTVRQSFNIPSGTIIISTIGKLVPWKSQKDIIFLLSELEKRNIPAVAFLMGSGPESKLITSLSKTLNKNRAILTGFIQPEIMMQYLSATDIYIHPAKIEPHSLAISEAIYLGCPVIVSDRCGSYGPTDDVQPGKNGFVYPFGNISVLADNVEFLFRNPDILKSFSENSLKIGSHNQSLAGGEALKAALNIIKSQNQ
jgi:glycosyltransferase involved in cell wall biosynthesis